MPIEPPEPPVPPEQDPPESKQRESSSSQPKHLQGLGQLATAGAELGLTLAVLVGGGWWLDGKLQTSPWLALTGAGIGILGGLYKFIRTSKQYFGNDS